jgi:hypothetical protein
MYMYTSAGIITINLITLNMLLGIWVFMFVLLYPLIKIVDLLD